MIINNVNPNKLHDELIVAGIVPLSVMHDRKDGEITAENVWMTFADGADMIAVQAVIDAHNPEPIQQEPTEIEKLQSQIETMQGALDFIILNY
ncbi:hypothetical protein [Sedimentibacter sp.]|uniref:hypothetical protein n=1 Tax=Sedimentibacter sp. TaxID=1960295 RepID=UPI0028AB6CA1|nr:hypothetical protein [Sedimentibacter sp.]